VPWDPGVWGISASGLTANDFFYVSVCAGDVQFSATLRRRVL
jgi:hypothetical protein